MTSSNPGKTRAASRLSLFLISGSILAVIIASTTLFVATQKGWVDLPALLGTRNNGELITPPRPMADLPLHDESGVELVYAEQPKQWTLLIPVVAHCDDACQELLYITRQVDLALGRDSNRVRRYLLATEGPLAPGFTELLQREHRDAKVVSSSAAVFSRFVDGVGDAQNPPRLYLVDPYGWLMMLYTAQHDGQAVLDDLRFLVKNSHENEAVE